MRHAPDMHRWQGRVDPEEGDAGRRWHQIVQPLTAAGAREGVALLGFACDAGVARNHGRTGARHGPAALRGMLANLPVRRCRHITDAGDIDCDGDNLESAQAVYAETLAGLLDLGLLPLGLGGGHEIAYASFSGLARHLAGREPRPAIGIINLDAHFDLRAGARATSGTPFRQIADECRQRGWPFHYCCLGVSEFANTDALFQRAQALGVTWRSDEAMTAARLADTRALLDRFMAGVNHVYLTICLDVLPAAVAPGVSAPAARGVPLEVIEPLLDVICASGKLRLADIAELNPDHDIDQRTARVAARLLARIAEHRTDNHGH